MGLVTWLQDCWTMMMRTKPQYISVLGRKRSSIRSPQKLDKDDDTSCKSGIKSCICLLVMCCSISHGVLLLLLNDASSLSPSNLLLPLIVAGIASISGGMCLSEYMSSKPQEVPSIYSCCYQYSSEVLAFFVGWSWLLSQAALVAAFCRLSAELLKPWTRDLVDLYFHGDVEALLGVLFVVGLMLLANTGLGDSVVWFVCSVPVVFVLVVVSVVMSSLSNKEGVVGEGWFGVQNVDQILHLASLSTLFFSGAQSILRLTHTNVHPRSSLTLGPLNLLSLILLISALFSSVLLTTHSSSSSSRLIASLICVPASLEALRHLFFAVEDMASDGLLFRGMAKKASPCACVVVPGARAQGVVGVGLVLAVGLIGMRGLLVMAVLFPVGVNSVVPYLVLLQRYRDNTSWQYEPMFQTTARTVRDHSRRRSEEHQYTNGHPPHHQHPGYDHRNPFDPCIEEEPSSSSSEDEEDIDSVVQQYRDQAKIANMATLDEHDPSDQVPEPTPTTAARAKVAIGVHFAVASANAALVNCGGSLLVDSQMALVAVGLAGLLLTTVVQAVLLCFPQNKGKEKGCCTRVPRMPWVPGVAAFINKCLFVNAVIGVWPVFAGWTGLGLLVYFGYGIRSSTAANSFYNLRPAHIALCPLPSYGNKCVTQVVPSQRKKSKTKLTKKNSRRKPIMA